MKKPQVYFISSETRKAPQGLETELQIGGAASSLNCVTRAKLDVRMLLTPTEVSCRVTMGRTVNTSTIVQDAHDARSRPVKSKGNSSQESFSSFDTHSCASHLKSAGGRDEKNS